MEADGLGCVKVNCLPASMHLTVVVTFVGMVNVSGKGLDWTPC